MSSSKNYVLSFTTLFYKEKGYVLLFNRHKNIQHQDNFPMSFEPWNRYSAWIVDEGKEGTKVKHVTSKLNTKLGKYATVFDGLSPEGIKEGTNVFLAKLNESLNSADALPNMGVMGGELEETSGRIYSFGDTLEQVSASIVSAMNLADSFVKVVVTENGKELPNLDEGLPVAVYGDTVHFNVGDIFSQYGEIEDVVELLGLLPQEGYNQAVALAEILHKEGDLPNTADRLMTIQYGEKIVDMAKANFLKTVLESVAEVTTKGKRLDVVTDRYIPKLEVFQVMKEDIEYVRFEGNARTVQTSDMPNKADESRLRTLPIQGEMVNLESPKNIDEGTQSKYDGATVTATSKESPLEVTGSKLAQNQLEGFVDNSVKAHTDIVLYGETENVETSVMLQLSATLGKFIRGAVVKDSTTGGSTENGTTSDYGEEVTTFSNPKSIAQLGEVQETSGSVSKQYGEELRTENTHSTPFTEGDLQNGESAPVYSGVGYGLMQDLENTISFTVADRDGDTDKAWKVSIGDLSQIVATDSVKEGGVADLTEGTNYHVGTTEELTGSDKVNNLVGIITDYSMTAKRSMNAILDKLPTAGKMYLQSMGVDFIADAGLLNSRLQGYLDKTYESELRQGGLYGTLEKYEGTSTAIGYSDISETYARSETTTEGRISEVDEVNGSNVIYTDTSDTTVATVTSYGGMTAMDLAEVDDTQDTDVLPHFGFGVVPQSSMEVDISAVEVSDLHKAGLDVEVQEYVISDNTSVDFDVEVDETTLPYKEEGSAEVSVDILRNTTLRDNTHDVEVDNLINPLPIEEDLEVIVGWQDNASLKEVQLDVIVENLQNADLNENTFDVDVNVTDLSEYKETELNVTVEVGNLGMTGMELLDVYVETPSLGDAVEVIADTVIEEGLNQATTDKLLDLVLEDHDLADGKEVDLEVSLNEGDLANVEETVDVTVMGTDLAAGHDKDIDVDLTTTDYGSTETTHDVELNGTDLAGVEETIDVSVDSLDTSLGGGGTVDTVVEGTEQASVDAEVDVTLEELVTATNDVFIDVVMDIIEDSTRSRSRTLAIEEGEESERTNEGNVISIESEDLSDISREKVVAIYEGDEADAGRTTIITIEEDDQAGRSKDVIITIDEDDLAGKGSRLEVIIEEEDQADKGTRLTLDITDTVEGDKGIRYVVDLTETSDGIRDTDHIVNITEVEQPLRVTDYEVSISDVEDADRIKELTVDIGEQGGSDRVKILPIHLDEGGDDVGVGLPPVDPPWEEEQPKSKVWLIMGKNYPAWNGWNNKKTR